ncbi:MAG: hypothetical protein HQ518_19830 [Rhodopirellula sp.]|nr:hypothetical protein [Rhodopirellula sp.]
MSSLHSNVHTFRFVSLVTLVVLTCVVAFGVTKRFPTAPLPSRKVFSAVLPPTMNQCAECHPDVCETFATAPHRLTLTRASSPEVREHFAGKEFSFAEGGPTVRYESRDDALWLESAALPGPLRVGWIFGSGQHAQTPVSVLTNPDGRSESLQHRVSWYPTDELAATPGLEVASLETQGLYEVFQHEDHVVTMDCFECHVTHLPNHNGRIDESQIILGVGCDRCHPGGRVHMASVEDGPLSIERWSELSPLESVNRCGECHRRADQLTEAELDPQRPVLARFASVGLVMSACFKQQAVVNGEPSFDSRLDCLTCHDPHRPASRDPQFYREKCLGCHGSDDGQAAECTSRPMSSNCLPCHMPKQQSTENLGFTDHWIRVPR